MAVFPSKTRGSTRFAQLFVRLLTSDISCVASTEFQSSLSCEYRVMKQQVFKVATPAVFSSDIATSCSTSGRSQKEAACGNCTSLHKPCDGTFVACHGCCERTSAPQLECKNFKKFYKDQYKCRLDQNQTGQRDGGHQGEKVAFDVQKPLTPVLKTECDAQLRTVHIEARERAREGASE